MPQLDLDILEDFLFFAFAALLLGLGDGEPEENVVARATEVHLAETYLAQRQQLRAESSIAAQVFRALPFLTVLLLSSCRVCLFYSALFFAALVY